MPTDRFRQLSSCGAAGRLASCVLSLINLAESGQGIDLGGRLVAANAHNSGKTQRKAAVVAVGDHDIIKRDFEHNERLNLAPKAFIKSGVLQKKSCQLL